MEIKMGRQWKNPQMIAGIIVFISTMNITAVRAQQSAPIIENRSLPQGMPIGVPVVGETVEDETVNEVRKYFKKRWRRDPNFAGYLQYNLTVQADGRVKSIVGIGDISQIYLERTNFLQPGERFLIASDREHILQIFLNGNGAVGVSPLKTPPSER
jgi:hypothetical protein